MTSEGRGILSPVRLPVPPLQLAHLSLPHNENRALKNHHLEFMPGTGERAMWIERKPAPR